MLTLLFNDGGLKLPERATLERPVGVLRGSGWGWAALVLVLVLVLVCFCTLASPDTQQSRLLFSVPDKLTTTAAFQMLTVCLWSSGWLARSWNKPRIVVRPSR